MDRFVNYWFTGVQAGAKAVEHDLDIWLDTDVKYRCAAALHVSEVRAGAACQRGARVDAAGGCR